MPPDSELLNGGMPPDKKKDADPVLEPQLYEEGNTVFSMRKEGRG